MINEKKYDEKNNKKSKTNKKTKKNKNIVKKLNSIKNNPKNKKSIKLLKKQLDNPEKFKIGKIKKKEGQLFTISTRKGKHIWRLSSKKEKECHKFLESQISFYLDKYKKGEIKNNKQAFAIAYSKTKNKYPNCIL